MTLEYNLGIKSVRNKSDLLDKNAMLALPGTSFDIISYTNLLIGLYMENMKEAVANVWLATLKQRQLYRVTILKDVGQ